MGCNCGSKARRAVWVLSYEDGRAGGEYDSKTAAEVADVQKGGGGAIRQVRR
ncbi:hypothetical protein HCA58_04955 [Micromonospora sp. HNM0581]|uniref:hypothetical protein n=1 Tax=Micromonospora sp. HNM0581 TaxID=2716341 RepID=UPI00146E1897|nr:hypothetical protein [Micromonospora sp. HNM0581]NLU77755.1 hypothetical protein [Micromonospora sp. HNM0581]